MASAGPVSRCCCGLAAEVGGRSETNSSRLNHRPGARTPTPIAADQRRTDLRFLMFVMLVIVPKRPLRYRTIRPVLAFLNTRFSPPVLTPDVPTIIVGCSHYQNVHCPAPT